MNNLFVPYEIALELKQLGYDEPCLAFFASPDELIIQQTLGNNGHYVIFAPLYQQVFAWFREKHKLNSFVVSSILEKKENKWYHYREDLVDRNNDSEPELTPTFETYEESQLLAIQMLIKTLKKRNDG